MLTIWKYSIPIDDFIAVSMPEGAQVLTVQMQRDTPCIWALVDTEAPLVTCMFRLFGTGNPISGDAGEYVGTFQMLGLVFHLFRGRP